MSDQISPTSSIGSWANSPGPSTQPSSPPTIESLGNTKESEIKESVNHDTGNSDENMDVAENEEDDEGMDVKAKALIRLLKTSSVG